MNKVSIKLLLIISLFANQAWAKIDTLRLNDNENFHVFRSSEILISSPNQTIEKVITEKDWKIPAADFKAPTNTALWIRFLVENPTDATQQIFIRNPDNEVSEYYIFENKKLLNKTTNGVFISTWGMNENQVIGVDSFSIKSKKTIKFYIKVSNYQGLLPFLRLFPQKPLRTSYYLKTEKKHSLWLNQYYIHNLNELQVKSIFLGGLGVILIIILLVLFQNRAEKLYKFYVLYIFSGFCYALLKSRSFAYVGKFIGYAPFIKIYGTELVMCWGVAAYFVFIAELLDLRKNHQKLYSFLFKTSKILFYYGLTVFIWMLLTNDSGLESKLYTFTRIILFIMYFLILALTSQRVKSTMVKYILLSNFILVTFSCIAWLKTSVYNDVNWYGIFNHLFTLPFAILLEIIVFILAIAKKVGDERQAKNALEKKAIEVEMMALRSQMNPHFVFNSLNTVRYFVLSDQKEKAKNYLAKFSKLLRTILSYSKENTISLNNELEAIKLYTDVELGRFESNFFYSIKIDEEIDLDSVMIPPLLLQPFVENAIIHGLRNSEKTDKILTIKVSQTNNETLEISITDNGIGRTKANEIQYRQDVLHKSFGTEITNQRIELYNQSYTKQIKIETTDLADDAGTQVLLQISI